MLKPRSPLQEKCLRAMEVEFRAIDDLRSSGGRVMGYLCQGFPAAVAAGLGMWPVRVLQETCTELEERGGMLVRPDVCPLIKSFLGGVSTGSGIYGVIDVWAGLATCDQTRRCFAELESLTGAEVLQIQLPSTRSGSAERYYGTMMQRFCREATSSGSGDYDPDAALSYDRDRYAVGELLARVSLTGSVPPLDLHWMYHLYHVARPAGLEGFFTSLLSESSYAAPSHRIALAGSPLSLEDTTVLEVLAEGGFGVVPLHCAALQSVPCAAPPGKPVSGSPLDLAARAFRSVKCARSRPNDEMFEYISELIDRTGCEGLIVKTMRLCDLWFTERERFREKMSVPVMVLDTAFSSGERERQTARLDAFMETLAR